MQLAYKGTYGAQYVRPLGKIYSRPIGIPMAMAIEILYLRNFLPPKGLLRVG